MRNYLFTLLFLCIASTANAAIILSNNSGTVGFATLGYPGHSFTTPSGNSFDTLTFSWISSDQTTRIAVGNLFLLTQEYLSSPDNLSAATTGFVAESIGVVSNTYLFDAAVTINPSTQYWVYAGSNSPLSGGGISFTNPFAGGQLYAVDGVDSAVSYGTAADWDTNFILEGNIALVPVPATFWLFGSALGLLGWMRRKST